MAWGGDGSNCANDNDSPDALQIVMYRGSERHGSPHRYR